MTAEPDVRSSPLGELGAVLAALPDAVRVRELTFRTQLNLRIDPSGPAAPAVERALGTALPVAANTTASAGDVTIAWLGPEEWLVLAPDGSAQALGADLCRAAGGEHGAVVVDLSAHRTTIELSGVRAAEVLGKGCSLDLHPAVFTETCCAQTLLARSPVILLARPAAEPCYWLLVRASYAAYVALWLIDACAEYETDLR